ncbi:nitroreductase/quinone reductase family protein [Microbispora sp. H10949]|uniref:nitroreductase/quinone reductase family protein n=1 Tax=Microbispora sp. H10949 TaxID=2729111 RepID=UPI00160263EE|nr:nitroreductase/quinone reductase family protein [Microbispora sp. H10949]
MARRSRLFNRVIRGICDWQVRTYRRTGGRRPATMRGIPVLLLTTRGRRTGLLRTRPVGYGRDGRRFVVIASNGGDDATPAWWLNLRDDPVAELEVGGPGGLSVVKVRASEAVGEEYDRLWRMMSRRHPVYLRYVEMTRRRIPVVVLEPFGAPPP